MSVSPPSDGHQSGEPAAEARDPWSPPPPGPAPDPASAPWTPYQTDPLLAARPPRNGMGITALVLGIVSLVLGVLVFLFWMTWLPGLLAVIFGIIGMRHARRGQATNGTMAMVGMILGGLGLAVSILCGIFAAVLVKEAAHEVRAEAKKTAASEKAEREKAAREEKARHLPFGGTYTFPNGLKVTVAEPEPFVPDQYAHGHAKGNKAVQVTITVVNTGKKRVDAGQAGLPRVNDADGASAELVIDGSGRQKVIDGYLLPGRQVVGKYAFSLPPDAADKAEVEFGTDLSEADYSYWSGPLHLGS
ncbi:MULTISPECIES: DUF4190 domain-containing protein [Streptomyces]|uniref:DUF4190 domain-containing protein n=2 Tax=Streptomyces rimosus subsp. rimosus TaxID=132474 RepID=A0A8A1UG36_STRR1|nr:MULTISPECIES: DUF4190 domain-containing protein [Streptomyces]KOG75560.1 hypothetical protein ADK78_11920 [Kitasatospora aureofaciens]MYT48118.1 DUF4190 domain-containing protein [Streptomyces sp. SID5471]KOT46309.1 hypothetical protein ADK42_00345 [Streptomyces rimosus subsp. rimosus]KOT47526.1 hypothetical protein ADK84_00340 [Streptomyces sp. NRRL WC-3701]KOT61809.1 hypothetical protein ADK44_13720 [Streptomyces rimosus subsp. rimosus]